MFKISIIRSVPEISLTIPVLHTEANYFHWLRKFPVDAITLLVYPTKCNKLAFIAVYRNFTQKLTIGTRIYNIIFGGYYV